ncbi:MAG: hypothetical protein Q4D13_06565 [Erysipelotrichaceae bacterium]|nr:hypothetical protein [Erysipelotrichaceae bacterium]
MKKLLMVLLIGIAAVGLVACAKTDTPSEVPEPVLGGWEEVEDNTVTDEMKDMFDKAFEGFAGARYEPVEIVATQVVAGTNYKFLCNGTKTTNPPVTGTYYVTIYQDLQGNVEVYDIETISEK